MAITWDVIITPINISTYEASIQATRTDDTDPTNPITYTIHKAKLETSPQQVLAMDRIWAKHQEALSEKAAVNAFVVAKQTAAKANLEGREP